MKIKIDDCSRVERVETSSRLEEVKRLFDAAFKKAILACELAKKELTRPLTHQEKEEVIAHEEGRIDL